MPSCVVAMYVNINVTMLLKNIYILAVKVRKGLVYYER